MFGRDQGIGPWGSSMATPGAHRNSGRVASLCSLQHRPATDSAVTTSSSNMSSSSVKGFNRKAPSAPCQPRVCTHRRRLDVVHRPPGDHPARRHRAAPTWHRHPTRLPPRFARTLWRPRTSSNRIASAIDLKDMSQLPDSGGDRRISPVQDEERPSGGIPVGLTARAVVRRGVLPRACRKEKAWR